MPIPSLVTTDNARCYAIDYSLTVLKPRDASASVAQNCSFSYMQITLYHRNGAS